MKSCQNCSKKTTLKGHTCYTTVRRLRELVRKAGKPFSPTYVIPAMEQIAIECKRYKKVLE